MVLYLLAYGNFSWTFKLLPLIKFSPRSVHAEKDAQMSVDYHCGHFTGSNSHRSLVFQIQNPVLGQFHRIEIGQMFAFI